MNFRRYGILLSVAVLAVTGSVALAQGHGHGNGNGDEKENDHDHGNGHGRGHDKKDGDEDAKGRGEYNSHDRGVIRGWYSEHERGLPPGLAKHDQLPPGFGTTAARARNSSPGPTKENTAHTRRS